ncbi:GNAT family N-acetyltransferase [Ekhidna sp.]|uniref:GNAT family N-acetyltransferase n=1 Tax=Ekhidna sp. TaxID=2608089 RepID=UPI003B504154
MVQFEVVQLEKSALNEVYSFLEEIFTREQNIPKELIPLPFDEQYWWCAKNNKQIIGTVAAWKDTDDWHWGRLAVDPIFRGHGFGKKLAVKSFEFLFEKDIDRIVIDARDITVKLLLSLGASINGKTVKFYGIPITPMIIYKTDFKAG